MIRAGVFVCALAAAAVGEDPFAALSSPDFAKRSRAVGDLAAQGPDLVPKLLKHAVARGPRPVAPVIWRIGPAAEAPLIAGLKGETRPAALYLLVILPEPNGARTRHIAEGLAEPSTRRMVLDALSEAGWWLRPVARSLDRETRSLLKKSLLALVDGPADLPRAKALQAATALGKQLIDMKVVSRMRLWSQSTTLDRDLVFAARLAYRGFRDGHLFDRGKGVRDKQVAKAIEAGLGWLQRVQQGDGHWRAAPGRSYYDPGVTALAISAFCGPGGVAGLDPGKHPRAALVRRAFGWLLAQQDKQGRIAFKQGRYDVYNHALATQALVAACRIDGDPLLRAPLRLAVDYILFAQGEFGWDYKEQGDSPTTSITANMTEALKGAWWVGMPVPARRFGRAREWIEKMTDPEYGQVGYRTPGGSVARSEQTRDKFPPERSQAMTAAGVLLRLMTGEEVRSSEMIRKGANLCIELPPVWNPDSGGIDMYFWWKAGKVMRRVGGNYQRYWEKALLQTALVGQEADGRWPAVGAWGMYGGEVYSTAVMVLCLQAAYG